MEAVAQLDTHVVVWLWAGDRARLAPIRRWIEEAELVICPVVELELQYLFEIQRISRPGAEVVRDLVATIGLRLSPAPLYDVVSRALPLAWTSDPFDRLIAASALADGQPLLTKDERMLANCTVARWG
jgi:PIN domain nuclease of toxin-antitoxin system